MSSVAKTEKEKKTYSNVGMLGCFLRGSGLLFGLGIAAHLVMTFLKTVIPQIIGFTIDCVIGDEAPSGVESAIADMFGGVGSLKTQIGMVCAAAVIVAAGMAFFRYLGAYLNTRANETFMRTMRDRLFSHIQRLPTAQLKERNTGDLIQRCTSDANTISDFVSNQFVSLVRIVSLLVLSIVFMFLTDVKLAAIAFSFIPVLLGYSLFFHFRASKSFRRCDEQEGVLSTYAQENLTGVRVIRAFGKERRERDKFEKQNEYYTGLWVRLERFLALYWTTSDLIAALQLLFIIVFGTVFCVNGGMTAGELVEFISYNAMMIGPVRQLGRIISNMSKANVALGRIAEVMNIGEEQYGRDDGVVSGELRFEGVGFEYVPGKPVLGGISFTLPQGGTLGVVGGTGSGKTTLAKLIAGLYYPTAGRITFGCKDITEIPPATLRKNVGLVLQDGYIYSRTIAENIGIAAPGASRDEIEHAAETACLDGNIEGFSQGYDTVVGERGVTLSGGQKQRLAIARTLMRNTAYIVFDDSLSAVDSETDAHIRAALESETRGATKVIVSHRIATVMNADSIIVLDGGKVVESGTHAELLEQGGIYRRIYDAQTAIPDELKEASDER